MPKQLKPTALPDFSTDKVKEVALNIKADAEYYKYGVEVIENRAIFGGIDGLIPVTRRALWAAHELHLHHRAVRIKSARIVGDVIGKYHPHGDVAAYDAIVTATWNNQPLFDGEGNWGTMTEPAAAMRYTNTRLSKYSDLVFFDPFYLPAIQYVPNYDGSLKEPLMLPSLLPNALLNGNFGIAPGVNTRSPSFTLESLVTVIQKSIKSGKCEAADCLGLVFTTRYRGKARQGQSRRAELKSLFKTGKGKVVFDSVFTQVDGGLRVNRFAPIGDIEKLLKKVEGVNGVQSAVDDSEKTDPVKSAYLIKFRRGLKDAALEKTIKRVKTFFSSTQNINIKVTDRYVDDAGLHKAKLRSSTVPEMIFDWIKYRMALERKACAYWIADLDKRIAYLELMRLAIKYIDFIVKCLKDKKLSSQQLDETVAKGLSITVPEAKSILDRPIRSLRALEDSDLRAKIKALQETKTEYEARRDKPAPYVYAHLAKLSKELA